MLNDPGRVAAQAEGRAMAYRARVRSNVQAKEIAAAIHVNVTDVFRRFDPRNAEHRNLSLTDMILMARQPETVEVVTNLLAELHALIDVHDLRVCDVDAMSKSAVTSDLARMAVRTIAERLWPEEMRKSAAVTDVELLTVIDTVELTKVNGGVRR